MAGGRPWARHRTEPQVLLQPAASGHIVEKDNDFWLPCQASSGAARCRAPVLGRTNLIYCRGDAEPSEVGTGRVSPGARDRNSCIDTEHLARDWRPRALGRTTRIEHRRNVSGPLSHVTECQDIEAMPNRACQPVLSSKPPKHSAELTRDATHRLVTKPPGLASKRPKWPLEQSSNTARLPRKAQTLSSPQRRKAIRPRPRRRV